MENENTSTNNLPGSKQSDNSNIIKIIIAVIVVIFLCICVGSIGMGFVFMAVRSSVEDYEIPNIEDFETYEDYSDETGRYGIEKYNNESFGDQFEDVKKYELPLEIEEFGDFQCPACGAYHEATSILRSEYREINFTFRHFPLEAIHDRAFPAAVASEAAREQGKFLEYHDMLFENQENLQDEDLFKYAENLGLDLEKFKDDYQNNQELKDRVIYEREEGRDLGVYATPTFILNGNTLFVNSPDDLLSQIDDILEESKDVQTDSINIESGNLKGIVEGGQTASIDNWDIRLAGAKHVDSNVIIDLDVTNNSSSPRSVISIIMFRLKDKNVEYTSQAEYGFDFNFFLETDRPSFDSEIGPGETYKGAVAFMVEDADINDLYLEFQPDFLGEDSVRIDF